MLKKCILPILFLASSFFVAEGLFGQMAVGGGLLVGKSEGEFAKNTRGANLGGGFLFLSQTLGNSGLSLGAKTNFGQYGYVKTDVPLAGQTVSISNSVLDLMVTGKLELPFLNGRFWPFASIGGGVSLMTTDLERSALGENPDCNTESTENLSKDWTKVLETGAGVGISLASKSAHNFQAPRLFFAYQNHQTGNVRYLYEGTENSYFGSVRYSSMVLGLQLNF